MENLRGLVSYNSNQKGDIGHKFPWHILLWVIVPHTVVGVAEPIWMPVILYENYERCLQCSCVNSKKY